MLFLLPVVGCAQLAELAKADSIAELYPHHSLRDLNGLSKLLTEPLSSPHGKFRAIYKWVCLNIENDYKLLKINEEKRATLTGDELAQWNHEFSPRVVRTLVEKQRTVCTGYALLVRELARPAGIDVRIIDGYGRSSRANLGGKGVPNHSWIAVKLDGKWRLCDPTWSSGSINSSSKEFMPHFEEIYFLAEPSVFAVNHYPLEKEWMLLDNPPTLESWLNAPLLYVTALRNNIQPANPMTFQTECDKKSAVSFSFTTNKETNLPGRVELRIDNAEEGKLMNQVDSDGSLRYTLDQKFQTRKTYVVHLVHDDEYLITYRVKVR